MIIHFLRKKFLTNAVTEVFVGENAHFDLIRVQNEHNAACKMTHTFIHQEKNSVATSNNMTLHGGLIRNSTYHYLGGKELKVTPVDFTLLINGSMLIIM